MQTSKKLKPELIVNCGSMFSGKSTALISQGQRYSLAGKNVVFLKPSFDTRWSINEINTHNHLGVPATVVDATKSIVFVEGVSQAEAVLIDEIQFFDKDLILDDIQHLLDCGKVVVVSGLDLDFNAEPFEITAELMAKADKVNKYQAVCVDCGDNAWVTAKYGDHEARLQLGGNELYKPLCRSCFNEFRKV